MSALEEVRDVGVDVDFVHRLSVRLRELSVHVVFLESLFSQLVRHHKCLECVLPVLKEVLLRKVVIVFFRQRNIGVGFEIWLGLLCELMTSLRIAKRIFAFWLSDHIGYSVCVTRSGISLDANRVCT